MDVYHEEFGIGEVINSTEKLDESGVLIAADVMFEHGIEQDLPLFEVTYSAKDAAAGKDIGKPGKEFKNIAAKAAAKYGSKEAGGRVAGAILKNLRKEGYEDSPADKAKDKKMEKKMGMSHAAFEKSAADKKQDAACEETEMTKEEIEDLDEKLIGNQKKIDANKNGKLDAQDFKMLRKEEVSESVVVAPRMTPDSASMRMPAVESVVRDIMSQHRNLRQEAKIADFKSRNK